MSNMRLLLELVAKNDGLRSGLNNSGRDVHTFVAGARREFDSLKGMATSLQGRLATLGVGVGVGALVMESARLNKSLTQIGQTAGEGGEKVKGLRKELFALAGESGQSVENLRDGFNTLIQAGLNMKEASATMEGVNIAMATTGADAKTLADGLTVAANAFGFDLSKPGQALLLLDKMTVAGRLGAAEMEGLSGIFSKIGVNARAAGLQIDQTLGLVEALSYSEKNQERLATLTDSTLRVFSNDRYRREAQKATGINFFDAKGARRNVFAVLADIKKQYGSLATDEQQANFVQKAFGKMDLDTIKGIRGLLQGANLSNAITFTQQLGQAGGTLKKDFNEATLNLIDQAGRMGNKLRDVAEGFVAPLNKTLAEWMKLTMADKKDGGLGLDGKDMLLGGGALIAGTALAARYGGRAIGGMADKLLKKGGSTAVGVAEGKALQMAAGVTPVFVVNADAIGGSGAAETGKAVKDAITGAGGSAASGAATRAGVGATLAKWWKLAGTPVAKGASYLPMMASRAGFVGAAFGGGYLAGTGLNKGIGALTNISSGGRYKGDGAIGEMFYDLIHRQGAYAQAGREQQVKNDIKVEINFDEMGRAMIRTRDMNTNTSINTMKRGSLMSPMESGLLTAAGMGY